MKLLLEHNPVPATAANGTLRKMTDKDRAELGLPPLLRPRGNRNFSDEGSFTRDHLDALRMAFETIKITSHWTL